MELHTPEFDLLIEQFQRDTITDVGLVSLQDALEKLLKLHETQGVRQAARQVLYLIQLKYELRSVGMKGG